MDNVVHFYKDKYIFLTGGTGFIGKMLLEKLLRECDINTVYLLVRPKKGVEPLERIENMFKNPVFDRIRNMTGKISNKIRLIEGDLKENGLGISERDKIVIQENVEVVFHCGASLNMGAALRDVTLTNVRSTSELLSILKDAPKIQAFVFVSTAYSFCINSRIEEKFYEPPIKPHLLIELAEGMNDNLLKNISSRLIAKWPNSYAFTKAVAENLLLEKGKNLPVALFRPTIVTSTVSEPVPGWTDNLYGPLGILLSQHCGVLRIVSGDPKVRADTVPGDMAVNALLCLAWHINKKWHEKENYVAPVLNFSGNRSSLYVPMKQYIEEVAKAKAPPFQNALWHPLLFIIKNRLFYLVLKFVLHTIPGFILDSIRKLFGDKPRMRRTYLKLDKLTSVLRFFLVNEWQVENGNVLALWNSLSEADKKVFPFDVSSIHAPTYFRNLLLGLKLYIAKEDMDKIKSHKLKFKKLAILHYTIKYSVWFIFSYSLFKRTALLLFKYY